MTTIESSFGFNMNIKILNILKMFLLIISNIPDMVLVSVSVDHFDNLS